MWCLDWRRDRVAHLMRTVRLQQAPFDARGDRLRPFRLFSPRLVGIAIRLFLVLYLFRRIGLRNRAIANALRNRFIKPVE